MTIVSLLLTVPQVATNRSTNWAAGVVQEVIFSVPNATAGSCTLTFTYPSQSCTHSIALDIANANTSTPIDNASCTSTPFCAANGTSSPIGSASAITTANANELVVSFAIFGIGSQNLRGNDWNYLNPTNSCTTQAAIYSPAFSAGAYTPSFASTGGSGSTNWSISTIAVQH